MCFQICVLSRFRCTPVMEEVETLLVEAEALPLVNGEGGGSPRELELIAELVKRA